MSTIPFDSPSTLVTFADVQAAVGDIPSERIRIHPTPGNATEEDVLRIYQHEKCLCELIDGVLVEKPVGAYEAYLATWLAQLIGPFIHAHDLGILLGAHGALKLAPTLVRIPDLAFISWAQLPHRRFPKQPIPTLYPDLAIEVLSESNTRAEMSRKLHDYFRAGTRLVWYLAPDRLEMYVYRSVTERTVVTLEQTLDGGDVLPGLAVPMQHLFEVRQEE